MLKRFYKPTLLVGFSLLLIIMSACSGDKKGNPDATELVIWHAFSGPMGDAFEGLVEDYNETIGKEQDVFITTVYQGTDITSNIRLVGKGDDLANTPDIGQIVGSDIPIISSLPITVNAEEYINGEDAEVTKDDLYEHMVRAFTYEDELVGVPFNPSTLMLYYNEDLLKEAGFDAPPKTMDEMTEYIEALTVKEGNSVKQYGLNMEPARYHLVNFLVSQSPNSFIGNNEGGRTAPMTEVTIGEDGTLGNFLTKLQDWNQTDGYKYTEDNINEEFASGVSAMAIMSSSRINTIKSLVGDNFKWNTTSIPMVNEADTSGASIGGGSLVMFDREDDKKLKAAWDFIQYVSTPEVQAEFSQKTGYLPVNNESENLDTMQEFYADNPQFEAALEQMKNSHPNAQEPFDLVNWEVDGIVKDIMLEFNEGKLTVDEAIDRIVDSYNNALDEYHRANS